MSPTEAEQRPLVVSSVNGPSSLSASGRTTLASNEVVVTAGYSSFRSETSSGSQQQQQQQQPPLPPRTEYSEPPATATATLRRRAGTAVVNHNKVSSLDFERVVNDYSIQATRDRYFLDREDTLGGGGGGGDTTRFSSSSTGRGGGENSSYGSIASPFSIRDASFHNNKNKKPARRKTRRSATRWILSAIVGVATGLVTIFIVHVTSGIVHWRIRTLDRMAQTKAYPIPLVFAGFCGLNVLLALAASMLCVYVAPEGTGSGIPEVKAYLNGVRVKKFTSWRLFGVKIVGTILAVSSSLAVGMEGPLVHIGAIVGASFTKSSAVLSRILSAVTAASNNHPRLFSLLPSSTISWAQSLWAFTSTNLAYFAIDVERRDLISIGASVGFAASFGAPIGGLLFILDDISSYFSKNMFLRTLVANAIGTFCLAVQSGNLSNYSIINLGTYKGSTDEDIFLERFKVIPLFLIVAVGGGALGGIFCATFEYLKVNFVDRLTSPTAKLLQVAVVSLITSGLTFYLPYMAWACKDVDVTLPEIERGQQFFCEPGQVNEMATMLFGSRDAAIKRILSDPAQFQQRTLWSIGILFYALMTLTYGSILPSGIFTPTVLIGASLGGAAGLFFDDLFGHNIPSSTFALLGVAAMLAGIQRSTVSISVILVEGTGQIKVLLPVVIVVLVARYVAGFFHTDGLYETSMRLKQYPYMDHEQKRGYDIVKVQEIMSSPPLVIGPVIKASYLVHMLQTTSHNGYPVVDPKSNKFLGLVRRDQLVALLECGVFQESDQSEDGNIGVYGESTRSEDSQYSLSSGTLRPGIAKSPLMLWAYHIKDDRYDYLKNVDATTITTTTEIEDTDDEFDQHEMIRNIRNTIRSMPENFALNLAKGTAGDKNNNNNNNTFAGDDALPSWNHVAKAPSKKNKQSKKQPQDEDAILIDGSTSFKQHRPTSSTMSNGSTGSMTAPKGFAEIGVNDSGNLIATWLNPEYRNMYVNISSVMNQGAFCVPEHLPVSKARFLFTRLGLRHVVVVGGKTGGEVVGIFTRANLLHDYIRERVGLALY